jgi:hypothetical protein
MPKNTENDYPAIKWTSEYSINYRANVFYICFFVSISDEMQVKLVLQVEDRQELWNTMSFRYKKGNKRGFMDISREETGSEIYGEFISLFLS